MELAKYVESLEGSVAEGEEMSAYVQKIHNLVRQKSALYAGTEPRAVGP